MVEKSVRQARTLAPIQTINTGWVYCACCLDFSTRALTHENDTTALRTLLDGRVKLA